ncbi:MAG TPA: RidA family protein [Permianibacter sp.]|nr:RidA family protein [Permianibacter sp.]
MRNVWLMAMAGLLTACAGSGAKTEPAVSKYLVNPGNTQRVYEQWHYAQAARVGDTIWVSGQPGAGAGANDIEGQTRAVFTRMKAVLEAAGASLDDVVELTSYHLNIAELDKVGKVKDEFMPNHYPAWTAIGTPALLMPDALIEIKAVAVVGSGKRVQVVTRVPAAATP